VNRPSVVLDASALLALLYDEPGATVVKADIDHAVISSVNLSEVVAKLTESSTVEESRALAASLGLPVVAFDEAQAYAAGALRPLTRAAGLSLGDRACLACAQGLGATVLTTDRAWKNLTVGPRIRVIR
jgi:ribonuclease VapC